MPSRIVKVEVSRRGPQGAIDPQDRARFDHAVEVAETIDAVVDTVTQAENTAVEAAGVALGAASTAAQDAAAQAAPIAADAIRAQVAADADRAAEAAGRTAKVAPTVDYLREELLRYGDSIAGQTSSISAREPTSAAGSRTMVFAATSSPRYPTGGVVKEFSIYLTAPGRFSVSSWTEDVPGSGTTFTPYDVRYFDGVSGLNTVVADVSVPMGGLIGFGVSAAGSVGVDSGLQNTFVRATSATENEQFTATNSLSFKFMVTARVVVPTGVSIPAAVDPIPAALLDDRFSDSGRWSLNGPILSGGALVSGASTSWAVAAAPTAYPYSTLTRRTFSAYADITGAGQVWGLSSVRLVDGFDLLAPAAIVDGADNALKVYRYDGSSGTKDASPAASEVIPWTLSGSSVRLDIFRDRFRFNIRLSNLLTGTSVSIPFDYSTGTASNATTGRPWGRPCILFPNTTAGGVRITRARYVADKPFPSGKPAKVVCIGDSITEGSAMGPNYDQTWPYLLEDERASRGAQDVAIAARGGQKSDGALASIGEAVQLCDQDTVAIILVGTNDAAASSATLATWRANIAGIISQLRTRTNRIALCALPPGPSASETKRGQFNADIVGGYFPGLLPPVRFDLALSSNNDGVTWHFPYRIDATHPNVAGNVAMLERLRLDCPEAFE